MSRLQVISYQRVFLEAIFRAKSFLETIVVISDSPISEKFKQSISSDSKDVIIYDSGSLDFAASHYLMTKATILICSNSQFSWTAGKFASGMVLIPKKWFGGQDNALEKLILTKSKFFTI